MNQEYDFQGRGVTRLLMDARQLMRSGDEYGANRKFRSAIDIQPDCWEAWLGYAETRGDGNHPLSMVPAYLSAYSVARTEEEGYKTFVSMTGWIPVRVLRSAFVRAYNTASPRDRVRIFELVNGVIGCDEEEMAALAIDLCPDDWRAQLVLAKGRQIRMRWVKPTGFFRPKWPQHAEEVFRQFERAYQLARQESNQSADTVASYIRALMSDPAYEVFATELQRRIGVLS